MLDGLVFGCSRGVNQAVEAHRVLFRALGDSREGREERVGGCFLDAAPRLLMAYSDVASVETLALAFLAGISVPKTSPWGLFCCPPKLESFIPLDTRIGARESSRV